MGSLKNTTAAFLAMLVLIISSGWNINNGFHKHLNHADTTGIVILQKWEMPAVLKEISGIAAIDVNRFACIMDEKATIFIYNTALGKIEKEIPFEGNGDFEGIAIVGKTAYALHARGKLFEIKNYDSPKPLVKLYETGFSKDQNLEGLCYDKKHNRLLISIKDKDPASDDYKGIYAFDLRSKKMMTGPVFKIDLSNEIFKNKSMRPSDLAIHPGTGDIYVLDGELPRLLVMSAGGKYKYLHELDRNVFPLPEGISFTTKGQLFISNEGKGGDGNILKVLIEQNPSR